MTASGSTGRPLVIGIGNRLRGDDGVGPQVAELVRARHGDTIDTATAEGDLSDLAFRWRPDQAVVLIDAMASGRPPGTIEVLDIPITPGIPDTPSDGTAWPIRADRPLSSHGVGLADAIALARAMGRLPRSLHIVAIEGQTFGHGLPLSEAVLAAAGTAADRIADVVPRGAPVDRG